MDENEDTSNSYLAPDRANTPNGGTAANGFHFFIGCGYAEP
jgi:hypothetical protein